MVANVVHNADVHRPRAVDPRVYPRNGPWRFLSSVRGTETDLENPNLISAFDTDLHLAPHIKMAGYNVPVPASEESSNAVVRRSESVLLQITKDKLPTSLLRPFALLSSA